MLRLFNKISQVFKSLTVQLKNVLGLTESKLFEILITFVLYLLYSLYGQCYAIYLNSF